MDTFDTINLSVFLVILLPFIVRMTFWKQGGQRVSLQMGLPFVLLWTIGALSLSANHHWNAPHRRIYQFSLAMSAFGVSFWQLAVTLQKQRQKASLKKVKSKSSQ
jgi:hypothetical protein